MRIGYQLHLLDLALNVSFELLLRQNLVLDFLGLLLQLPSMLKSQRHRALVYKRTIGSTFIFIIIIITGSTFENVYLLVLFGVLFVFLVELVELFLGYRIVCLS